MTLIEISICPFNKRINIFRVFHHFTTKLLIFNVSTLSYQSFPALDFKRKKQTFKRINVLTVGEVLHPPVVCVVHLRCPAWPTHHVVQTLQLLLQAARVAVLDICKDILSKMVGRRGKAFKKIFWTAKLSNLSWEVESHIIPTCNLSTV